MQYQTVFTYRAFSFNETNFVKSQKTSITKRVNILITQKGGLQKPESF